MAVACGKKDADKSTTAVTVADMTGIWNSVCFNLNGFDEKGTATYTAGYEDGKGTYAFTFHFYKERSGDLSSRCADEDLLFTQVESGLMKLGNLLDNGATELDVLKADRSVKITSSNENGAAAVAGICKKVGDGVIASQPTLKSNYGVATAWEKDKEVTLYATNTSEVLTAADACGIGLLQPSYLATSINSDGKLLGSDVSDPTKGQTVEDRITTINALIPLTKQ